MYREEARLSLVIARINRAYLKRAASTRGEILLERRRRNEAARLSSRHDPPALPLESRREILSNRTSIPREYHFKLVPAPPDRAGNFSPSLIGSRLNLSKPDYLVSGKVLSRKSSESLKIQHNRECDIWSGFIKKNSCQEIESIFVLLHFLSRFANSDTVSTVKVNDLPRELKSEHATL